MEKRLTVQILTGLLMALAIISCSPNDSSNMPYTPPAQVRGRIAVINESNVSIRIAGYSQVRGDSSVSINLGVHLFPNQTYYLQNLIERSMGQSFMGGDLIRVTYIADAPDPDNPSEPLFRSTIELTVNGTYYIQVKNGGVYSIYPGN